VIASPITISISSNHICSDYQVTNCNQSGNEKQHSDGAWVACGCAGAWAGCSACTCPEACPNCLIFAAICSRR